MFWPDETTPTLATDRTCLLMAWLEVFAVAMVTVAEVSFMPRSLPAKDAKTLRHKGPTKTRAESKMSILCARVLWDLADSDGTIR